MVVVVVADTVAVTVVVVAIDMIIKVTVMVSSPLITKSGITITSKRKIKLLQVILQKAQRTSVIDVE